MYMLYMSMKQSLFKRSIVLNKKNAIPISTRPLNLPGNTCLNKSTNKKFYCLNFSGTEDKNFIGIMFFKYSISYDILVLHVFCNAVFPCFVQWTI